MTVSGRAVHTIHYPAFLFSYHPLTIYFFIMGTGPDKVWEVPKGLK